MFSPSMGFCYTEIVFRFHLFRSISRCTWRVVRVLIGVENRQLVLPAYEHARGRVGEVESERSCAFHADGSGRGGDEG